jgi:iron complex outermembrane receptor protein
MTRLLFFVLLALTAGPILAQSTGSLTGRVTDNKGVGLPGAAVVVKGTSNGTSTDGTGAFTLKGVDPGNVSLTVSFVGFTTKEVLVPLDKQGDNLTISMADNSQQIDEVVVTGVFDQRTKMESSVAISTLNSKQIQLLAPTSAADLLKTVPGVYVNQARGEINNTVYTRGISAGSIDNANGYYYVSLQEDGLPVTNVNLGVDNYLRADVTVARLEAVRGGTASILGTNSPGGIFNYVSKTGGQKTEAEIRTRFGLEGDGKNPYYRADANLSGPLNAAKDLTYSIGGFYRTSQGARYPGYQMNNGGQVKGNLVKNYATGSLKLYGKLLLDHNAVAEFIPTQGFADPKIMSGLSATDSYYLPDISVPFPINGGEKRTFNTADKVYNRDRSIGLLWTQELGRGLTLTNNFRYSNQATTQNTPTVVTPISTTGLLFYAIPHLLGKFGTYTFTDQSNGQVLGTVTQSPNIINGMFAGFNFTPGANNNFPGANVQPNSLFFLPMFYQDTKVQNVLNRLALTKKLDNMSFTLGGFYANTLVDRLGGATDAGIGFGTIEDRPHLTNITLNGFDGKTYQVTDPNGIVDVGRDGINHNHGRQEQIAFFFGHDWKLAPKLHLDYGLRYEHTQHTGYNVLPVANPLRADPTYGGLDGNPLTLYDNGGGTDGSPLNFDQKFETLSYTAALNYAFSDSYALYGRYSNGRKSPDLTYFFALNTPFLRDNPNAFSQKTEQMELGFKAKTEKLSGAVTPFYSQLSNVATVQTFTNPDNTTYTPPVQFARYQTYGVEVEANYALSTSLSVRATATVQKSKATEITSWLANANGPQDDVIVDYSGNETDNNAQLMLSAAPTYTVGKFLAQVNWFYLGDRQANVANAFTLPGFNQFDATVAYDLNNHFRLQGNVNNIFNTYGVLGWSGPGGFPAALDRQAFTPAFVQANPNAVYATQGSMPRAYFLSAVYKF